MLVGDVPLAAPRLAGWRPPAHVERHPPGALRGPGVRVLIAVFALCGLASARSRSPSPPRSSRSGGALTGLLLGMWGLGSLFTSFAVARAGAASDPPRRLAVLLVAWGAAHAALALAVGPLSLAGLLLLAGGAISPVIVYANAMLDHLAPDGTLAEAFTWTTAGLTAGMAIGAAVAGALVEWPRPRRRSPCSAAAACSRP